MKKIRKMLFKFLAVTVMTCSLMSTNVSAASVTMTESTNASARAFYYEVCLTDSMGNQYADKIWPSLGAAMNSYGNDFSYHSCYKYFRGDVYNYYYDFAEGTKTYFRVLE